jgi:6-phosphogluconolactonase
MNGELRQVGSVPEAFVNLLLESHSCRPAPGFSIALSGGSTARRCYQHLSGTVGPEFWSTVEVFWGDERCVPLDDADSNFNLAHECLGTGFASARALHPMDFDAGVDAYDRLIAACLPLDLVHLGLGPDGHTASLFPDSSALQSSAGRFVVMNTDPHGVNPHQRMTFTYEAISKASLVVVTVEGASKHTAIQRVLDGDRTAPATLITNDRIVWLVDEAALRASTPR